MTNSERLFSHEGQIIKNKEQGSNSGKIIVVRHAQSTANVSGLYTINNPALTDLGRDQAHVLGLDFANEGITFDSVYTSGKDRANDTAHGILNAMDLSLPITVRARLREKKEGLETELLADFAHSAQKQLDTEKSHLSDAERWDYIPHIEGIDPDNFETERKAAHRMHEEIISIATSHPEETTLIVSHFMAMRAHLAFLQEKEHDDRDNSLFSSNWVANTGFYVISPDTEPNNGLILQRKSLRRK